MNVVADTVAAVTPPETHRDCAVTPASVDTPLHVNPVSVPRLVMLVCAAADTVAAVVALLALPFKAPLNVVADTVAAVTPPETHSDCAVTPARVETPTTFSVEAAVKPPDTYTLDAVTPARVDTPTTASVAAAVTPPDTHSDCAVTPARVATPVTWSAPAVIDEVNIRGAVTPPTTARESAVTPAKVDTPTTERVEENDPLPETPRVVVGAVIPIPTLPDAVIRTRSRLLVLMKIGVDFALSRCIPVAP